VVLSWLTVTQHNEIKVRKHWRKPPICILVHVYVFICSTSEKFLSMPLEEKRSHYKDFTYDTSDKIESWQDYFLKAKERLQKQCKLFMHTL
jgi:hypothetical protein